MTIESLISNLIIGAVGSLIASVIFLQYTKRRDKTLEKRKYANAVGKYIGYEQKGDSVINRDNPLSQVEITYINSNILNLTVKEINHPSEWSGQISMESNYYGTIVWHYSKINGENVETEKHLFGLKKFVFYENDNVKIAYLIGEKEAGYSNEILIELGK